MSENDKPYKPAIFPQDEFDEFCQKPENMDKLQEQVEKYLSGELDKVITPVQKFMHAIQVSRIAHVKELYKNYDAPRSQTDEFLRAEVLDLFFDIIAVSGNFSKANRAITRKFQVNIHYKAFDALLEQEPTLKARYEQAQREFVDSLEEEAARRGKDGTEKGIYYKGERVATETEYSDALLTKLLQANAPEKYKDRQEITGANGGGLQVGIVDFTSLYQSQQKEKNVTPLPMEETLEITTSVESPKDSEDALLEN